MIYKFRSKATGDLIMLGPNGDRLMQLLGREPAAKGIIETAAMADALDRLRAAVAADEATGQENRAGGSEEQDKGRADRVTLRSRVWPMVQMLERAMAAGEPIVWGV